MKDYFNTLTPAFEDHANHEIARGQKAYMKHQFAYFGIKAPVRQKIQQPFFIKKYLPSKPQLEALVKKLWDQPQREYQYFAQELVFKYVGRFEKQDIRLLEFMITHKSWWDTVDYVAAKLVGAYFKSFPEERRKYVDQWLASGNIWLQRTALLFQLQYKDSTDTGLLAHTIRALSGSKEFFINKAIGWILRQYGKTNPQWVVAFTRENALANLSRREALRLI